MDPVNHKELKGKFKDRKDKDIDNDGDEDSSDEYLHKRRKAVSKAISKIKEAAKKCRAEEAKTLTPRDVKAAHDRKYNKMEEAVAISHDRYMRSHGKKARDPGHSSGWFFTHKNMGHINNYDDPKEVHFHQGRFADAKKSAQKWAKSHGHSTVYVMEEVELDEISQEKLRKYEIENEKDRERLSKKIGWIRNNKPTSQQKKDIAKLKSRNDMSTMSSKKRYPSVWQGKNAARVPATESTLDEVSKKTLGSYIKKAAKDMEKRGIRQGNPQASIAWVDKHSQKADKRAKGIARAVGKMAKEEVEMDEGIVKPYQMAASKPWSVNVKRAKGTAGEYSQIAKGKDFTVWTGYVGSQKRMPHYVVRGDKVIGSGWTMNSALKDAGLKDKDLTARSKFARGSILNKGMKEAVQVDEDISKMSHGRLKWHVQSGIPHGSYTRAELKKEKDRRLKYRDSADAYKKAKPGLYEEVNLDEVSTSTLMKYRTKANRSKDRASDSAIDKMLRSKDGPTDADFKHSKAKD